MRGRSQPVGTMQTNTLNIDLLVGKRIRLRRKRLKMSQTTLGHALGISFQQIQKYEKGLNRVSAGRLKEISDILTVPISFFYADIITKQHALSSHDEIISNTEEYLLLKRFRTLTSIKQRAILQLFSEPNESF
ncbi:helix-turn-helix transcriptional regulator [Bartonella kosoyi]|uniref:Helix-turn-helix transcriptional regulator n=1 Tax=Bartonella kosoyi TaxID=2133959 RepID=A0A5B9CVA1_9HYPH|nr:helix-turn-helix transcriptional regulator [Bartonella kosoyi]QEE08137.1 helix-turn-helix transcriptional regulator [Bartonella kosoyi]